jgi:anaerobic dimethyl sulfoxide reductase subunit B (iron-sulfur subunit)
MAGKLDKEKVKAALRRKLDQLDHPVRPARQLGFIHHNVDCIGCRSCEIACKDKNDLPAGPRFRRVLPVEGGRYPDVYAYKLNMACNHCAEPACLPTCPTGAIWKRAADGIVDIDASLCIGCRRCEAACPYGAPQWDPQAGVIRKCNFCVDEIDAGRKPYCVMACLMRVLDMGPIEQLRAGTWPTPALAAGEKPVRQVRAMADPDLTEPSIVFIPHRKGRVDRD